MKRFYLLLVLILLNNIINAQWKVKPVIGVSQEISLFGTYKGSGNSSQYYTYSYPASIIEGGIDFSKSNYNLGLRMGLYYLTSSQIIPKEFKEIKKAVLKSCLIDLGIINRFREYKIIRPFIRIDMATEIITNYLGKYLDYQNYIPERYFLPFEMAKNEKLNIYHSTPFVGDLLAGCDFRIYKGFSVNVGIGYGVRVIRVQYARVTFPAGQQPSTPIKEEKLGSPYSLPLNYLVIQAGLSYAFDIHKKQPKTITP